MMLRDYLFKNEIKLIDFAKSAGLSNAYISTIKNRKLIPSKSIRILIEFITNGDVKAEKDWRLKK